MSRKLFVILVDALLCVGSSQATFSDMGVKNEINGSEMVLVHVVFRHADRSPSDEEMALFPRSVYYMDTMWPHGRGALTNRGKLRSYHLGQFFREQYGANGFLKNVYFPDELYTYADDYDRCKMTALGVVAGLYPPVNVQRFQPDLSWQPIPYHTLPFELDETIYGFSRCRRFLKAYREVIESSEFHEEFSRYLYLPGMLTNLTGANITSLYQIALFGNLIRGMSNINYETPEWVELMLDDLSAATGLFFRALQKTDEMKTLIGGPLLNTILENCRAKMNGTLKSRRLVLYSEHDVNVMALMSVIGVYKMYHAQTPDYCAAIALELRRDIDTGEYGFSVMYLSKAGEEGVVPEYLEVPDCGLFCPFDTFVKITQNVTATFGEVKKMCDAR